MLVQRNGKSYWYTYLRQGGKVRRVYAGSGPVAELAALEAQERDRLAQVDALLEELITQTNHLVQAALEAAGYHRHLRGPWRKRRHVPDDQENQARPGLRESDQAVARGGAPAGGQGPGTPAS